MCRSIAILAARIIEGVRETLLADHPSGVPSVFEHAVRAPTGDELLAKLDDGRQITVVQTGLQVFQPVERAGGYPPFQP